MAIEVVPADDKRCDVCAGNEPIRAMCQRCYDEFVRDMWVSRTFLSERREVKSPDDPNLN